MAIFLSPSITTTQRIGSRADRTVTVRVVDWTLSEGDQERDFHILLQTTTRSGTVTEMLDMTRDVARQLRDQLDRAITAYEEG